MLPVYLYLQKGTKAPQAAGRIHTDFEKGFIMADVMHYKDFKEEGSEASCKSAGKYRQQGTFILSYYDYSSVRNLQFVKVICRHDLMG